MGNREGVKKKEQIMFGGIAMTKTGVGSYYGEKGGAEVIVDVGKGSYHLGIKNKEGQVQLNVTGKGKLLTGYIGNDKLEEYVRDLQSTIEQIRNVEGRALSDVTGPRGEGTVLKRLD